MKKGIRSLFCSVALAAIATVALAPAGQCQKVKVSVEAKTGNVQLKPMSSLDLKNAISYAATNGDITDVDAKELIDKINDIETLMTQFEFIRDHERSMISTMGAVYH